MCDRWTKYAKAPPLLLRIPAAQKIKFRKLLFANEDYLAE
jgi:hypothetical protein